MRDRVYERERERDCERPRSRWGEGEREGERVRDRDGLRLSERWPLARASMSVTTSAIDVLG